VWNIIWSFLPYKNFTMCRRIRILTVVETIHANYTFRKDHKIISDILKSFLHIV
jgi:hypothetical protein